MPGRGDALVTQKTIREGIDGTRAFVTAMYRSVEAGQKQGKDLKEIYKETYSALKPEFGEWVIFDHCLPFDVARAYDIASGIADPQIWTAERDSEMWEALEG